MPQYFSPGVYVEEVDSGPRPIQGVSTSVTGAVGVTLRGPTDGKPVLVTSFNDFTKTFGGFMKPPEDPQILVKWSDPDADGGYWWQFPQTVDGFFKNGGQQLYVKRVFSSESVAANATVARGPVSRITQNAENGDRQVIVNHLFGVEKNKEVAIVRSGQPTRHTVTAVDTQTNTVTLAPPLTAAVSANGDYVALLDQYTFSARARGSDGNSLNVALRQIDAARLVMQAANPGERPLRTTLKETPSRFALAADYDGGTTLTVSSADAQTIQDILNTAGSNVGFNIHGPEKQGEPARTLSIQVSAANPSTGAITTTAAKRNEVQVISLSAVPASGALTVDFTKADNSKVDVQIQHDLDTAGIQGAINNALTGDSAGPAVTVQGALASREVTVTFDGGEYAATRQTAIEIRANTLKDAGSADVEVEINEQTKGDSGAFIKGGSVIEPENTEIEIVETQIVVSSGGFKANNVVSILGNQYQLSDVTPRSTTRFRIEPSKPIDELWDDNTEVRKLRVTTPGKAGNTISVRGAARLYSGALIELYDNAAINRLTDQPTESFTVVDVEGSTVTLSGEPQNAYHEGQPVFLVELEVDVAERTSEGQANVVETISNLRLTRGSDPLAFLNRVQDASTLVQVAQELWRLPDPLPPEKFPDVPVARLFAVKSEILERLSGGDDRLDALTIDDFAGEDEGSGRRTGVRALEDIDDISLVLVPGIWGAAIQGALIAHCEAMRYRFALLDPPPNLSIERIQEYREPIDTRFAALYYPWILVRDLLLAKNVSAPPSGHLAGIFARVDAQRGVQKAPANEVIQSISGLNQDITRREQDLLNPRGINALRFFPGRGNRVWGARTVSSDSNFRYVNVRRIFNFIEASIDNGTQFVVFEPNDETLWARVRQTVRNFLNTQWRNGVLEGSVPEEAYFVECDRGVTMTQDDIENGRLICEVGIAPVFPAEFVIFRIQKFTAESKLA